MNNTTTTNNPNPNPKKGREGGDDVSFLGHSYTASAQRQRKEKLLKTLLNKYLRIRLFAYYSALLTLLTMAHGA